MLNIVMVDDNAGDQLLFRSTLKETGIESRLLTANNGKDGIELVKKEKPDLLVLDLMMPVMSGYDVYSALRFKPHHEESIPILLVTGLKEGIDPLLGASKKVYYLQKPYKMEELKDMLQNIFKGRTL